jgi:tetratricopeptide (TPR) repeat protein
MRRTRSGGAHALNNLADVGWRLGRFQGAVGHVRRALELNREQGNRYGEAQARNILGEVLRATGEPADACTQHGAALGLSRQTGDLYEQARAHRSLGRALDDLGDSAQARYHWREALVLYTKWGTPEADQVRAQLAAQLPESVSADDADA